MLLALAAGIFALDYKIKEYVNSEWLQGSRQEILHGRLILRNCHNHGFSGILKPINSAYGTEISGLVLGGVIWEFLRQTVAGGRKTARLGLALVLGGGAGNYAERRRKGFVTDYVSLGVGNSRIRKWVFNFSDVCIVLGGLSWAGASLLPKKKK